MKAYLGLVVALSAIGCAAEELDSDTGETVQAATNYHCPNPEDCTQTNGGGGYTQEMGKARLGPTDLMITHFINQGGYVEFQAREWDDTILAYRVQTGTVEYARYNSVKYSVRSIEEVQTVPTISLHRVVNGVADDRTVTGDDLVDLQLILSIKPRIWTVSFKDAQNHGDDEGAGSGVDQLMPGPGRLHVTLKTFDMFWNAGETLAPDPVPYCYLAKKFIGDTDPRLTDPVLFQQGIIVNAATVVVARNVTNVNNYVTLSCLHGAIATARWWGYVYNGTSGQTNMFEAAMHMKRASYCGDDTFFTRRNTEITVRDWLTPPNLNENVSPTTFEASWGMTPYGIRAICVNKGKRRRPGALYPPVNGIDFDGHCADNTTIPDCSPDTTLYPAEYGPLADQRVPQSP